MPYMVGVDIGGTFTDCVVLSDDGSLVADKAFSTPDDPSVGMLAALGNAAQPLGIGQAQVLRQTRALAIGTTSLLNRLVTRRGAHVGLLTTKGHEDAILIGRVAQKTDGLPEADLADIVRWDKPAPLVSRSLIFGLTERVDWRGAVVVPLREQDVVEAAARLRAANVDAVAVSLLWSFLNPDHEQRVGQILARDLPDAFVSLSSEVAPVLGEYERTATALLNAYLGPGARQDLEHLAARLGEAGFSGELWMMQSTGGVLRSEQAPARAVHLLGGGPVGGIAGAAALSEQTGHVNVIATDMGGTSFDVGLIVDGRPEVAQRPIYDRLRTAVPAIEVVSIGAGGGSVACVDADTGILQVGPQSAGSRPGPLCYGWGGQEPTVTDANLVLGRLNPERFFAGRKRLDAEAARAGIEARIARPLGMTVELAAKGIVDIVDAHMADLIRRLTVERGHDPRDFLLLVYGGGGPGHVGAFARELGVRHAVIPPTAAVFSAFGIATSDLVCEYLRSEPMRQPASPDRVNAVFADLQAIAMAELSVEDRAIARLERFVDAQFRYQAQQIRVSAPAGRLTASDLDALEDRFIAAYEQTFGPGAAYRDAGVELATFRIVASIPRPRARRLEHPLAGPDPTPALRAERAVFMEEGFERVPIYDGERLRPGMAVTGPALVEHGTYSLLLHAGQVARVDASCGLRLAFAPPARPEGPDPALAMFTDGGQRR